MKKLCTLAAVIFSASAMAQTIGTLGTITGTDGITYTTIVAKDGYTWIQQNLGATQVATSDNDVASYGSLYQWGRWNDGHEVRTPDNIHNGTPTANDPTGTGSITGSPFYYPNWWYNGSAWTDHWNAPDVASISDTNGCDPCKKILGGEWHIPNDVEWRNVRDMEGMSTSPTVLTSSLKIAKAGKRKGEAGDNGLVDDAGSGTSNYSYFWTNKSCMQSPGTSAKAYIVRIGDFSSAYGTSCYERGNGLSIRCIKSKTTAVNNISASEAYVALYPNPVQNELFINAGAHKIQSVKVMDMCGKVVAEQKAAAAEVRMPMAELATGMYMVHIQTDAATIVRKITKQ